MLTFLEETLQTIQEKTSDFSSAILILPSKRAGGFLKNYIRKHASQTYFLPQIVSIEEFIESLSDLTIIDSTELLFKSYEAYLQTDSIAQKDDFETFSSWISTLLSDLNEIDRHLVPQKQFFDYLSGIQDINYWYLKQDKTELIENYLNFWKGLPEFYERLSEQLLEENLAYQGLAYRKAAEDIEHYIALHGSKEHVFIGFNALNKAEQYIVQALLENGNTDMYWDADRHFLEDSQHSASLFLRRYVREWKYFDTNTPLGIGTYYTQPKEVTFVETQSNIAQAKYLNTLLSPLTSEELSRTTIVLADENLLHPVLNALPSNVTQVNITMGATLRQFPATVFFELLLHLHRHPLETLYYKDVITLLNHPLGTSLVPNANALVSHMAGRNLTYLSLEKLCDFAPETSRETLQLLFGNWMANSREAISRCKHLCVLLLERSTNRIQQMVLQQLEEIFIKIEALRNQFPGLTSVQTVKILFTELLTTTQLDFEGDAYTGLQIMGVLETRVLDFENVILLSANEGILPSGKTEASFITYDLKQAFDLPHYTDKDAIYAYHFYRLLHRAQRVTCLYNSRTDGLNSGEKSRFLLQMELDKTPQHQLTKVVLTPRVSVHTPELLSINKTPEVMTRLREIAGKGFSPSALTMYIRNPLDFYYKKILGVNESEDIEETVAANTMGVIVHNTLEAFYKPLEGSLLTREVLSDMIPRIDQEVVHQFQQSFKSGNFRRGKNLIIFEVTKRYVSNLIKQDLSALDRGDTIKIVKIEQDLTVPVSVPGLDFPVAIRGMVDRVDEYNGQLRVIDYKTGLVKQPDMEISDWEDLITDYRYSKALQVLAYAEMIHPETGTDGALTGVISFKNLNSGYLTFADKSTPGTKQREITQEIRDNFMKQLATLIAEICNPDTPFIEKEI